MSPESVIPGNSASLENGMDSMALPDAGKKHSSQMNASAPPRPSDPNGGTESGYTSASRKPPPAAAASAAAADALSGSALMRSRPSKGSDGVSWSKRGSLSNLSLSKEERWSGSGYLSAEGGGGESMASGHQTMFNNQFEMPLLQRLLPCIYDRDRSLLSHRLHTPPQACAAGLGCVPWGASLGRASRMGMNRRLT